MRTRSVAINFWVSAVAMALGIFVLASPARAAKVWGSEKFYKSSPEQRVSLLRWWRTFGFLLCLAAVLNMADGIAW